MAFRLKAASDHTAASQIDITMMGDAPAVARVKSLIGFRELVTELGDDAELFLKRAGIDASKLQDRHAAVSFRAFATLLEDAATALSAPDFGLRFAAEQTARNYRGPLELVMFNSETMGDAYRHGIEHVQASTTGAQLTLEEGAVGDQTLLRFEVLLPNLPYQRQITEKAILGAARLTHAISQGRVLPRGAWFTHGRLAPQVTYANYFNCPVLFDQETTGLLLSNADLETPVPNVDPQLYELAATFIEHRFPPQQTTLRTRVQTVVARLLRAGDCSFYRVAAALAVHPRTLQRRLRDVGESFETIRDGVRRDLALHYLRQSRVPLVRVAELVGYAEASVLSRSCNRWFSASPSELRMHSDSANLG